MRSLLVRVTLTFFITTAAVVLGLMLVVNYQVSENFSSYLYMSNMHSMMMNHSSMASMMGTPEKEFFISLRQSLIFVGAMMLLIGAVVSYYLARSIATPIIHLNQAVNKVAEGKYDSAVAVRRHDEIGQLADAFNDMTEKLKSSIVLRQRFLAGIAHELRTPLTILKANLEGIADGVITPDQEQMNSLTEEVDRLTTMVSELRDLSLLEAGQLKPDWSEIDVSSILRQIIQKCTLLANEKSLGLSLTIEEDIPRIWADAGMVQQMLYNLILNAIRYTTSGNIIISAGRDKTGIKIEVTDTGIGIAPDEIENIFDYFYRVDQARAKQSGGTGLGLALVKQMALAHGGKVYATSMLGEGSTFTLNLPLNIHQKRIVSP